MKKLFSLFTGLALTVIIFSVFAGAATFGSGNWNAETVGDPARWQVNDDGFLTMKSGALTLAGFNDASGDHTGYSMYSDNYELEFDVKLAGTGKLVFVLNCRSVTAYGGTRIAFDMTYGIVGGDYNYAASAGAAFAGADSHAGIDETKEFQHIKIQKSGGKLSIWVNGVANVVNQAVTNCDAEGIISIAYEGDSDGVMKNFMFTSGRTVIKDFTEDTGTVASDSGETGSETDSSASSAPSGSNPDTSDNAVVFAFVMLVSAVSGAAVLVGKKRLN